MGEMSFLKDLWMMTLRRPGHAADAVCGLRVPGQALWLAGAAVAVLSAIMSTLGQLILPAPEDAPDLLAWFSPLGFAAVSFLALILSSAVFTQAGRVLGGKGQFRDVFALMIWLQMALLPVELGLVILTLLAPVLGSLLTLAAYIAAVVWLVLFLKQAHEFASAGKAVATFLLGMFLVGFVAQILFFTGGGV